MIGDIDSPPPPRTAPVILPPPDPHLDHPLSDMDRWMAMVAKSTALVAKSAADLAAMTASSTARWDGMDERDKERLLTRRAKQFTSLGKNLRRGKRIGLPFHRRRCIHNTKVHLQTLAARDTFNQSPRLHRVSPLEEAPCHGNVVQFDLAILGGGMPILHLHSLALHMPRQI